MTVTADLPLDLAPVVRRRPASRIAKPSPEKGTLLIGIATFAALVGLWFAASHFHWASPLFLPSPAEVAAFLAKV